MSCLWIYESLKPKKYVKTLSLKFDKDELQYFKNNCNLYNFITVCFMKNNTTFRVIFISCFFLITSLKWFIFGLVFIVLFLPNHLFFKIQFIFNHSLFSLGANFLSLSLSLSLHSLGTIRKHNWLKGVHILIWKDSFFIHMVSQLKWVKFLRIKIIMSD